ncbi:trehalose biosynthesis protein [Kineococcus sp. NUM-3379]
MSEQTSTHSEAPLSVPGPAPAEEALAPLLGAWLPGRRWFAHKGGDVSVTGTQVVPLPGPAGVRVLLVLAATRSGSESATYQVPLTVHPSPATGLEDALVGELPATPAGEPGGWVYDGAADPAFVHALLGLVAGGRAARGPGALAVRGVRPASGLPVPVDARTRVLRGEQSNTSVIVEADGHTPLIAKLFRVLHPGDNPDVVVQSALAAAGCSRVPRPAGWVEGTWGVGDTEVRGHLAFVTEFLAGSEDAWRVACAAVEAGRDFTAEAGELGRATAQVHAVLAATLPTAHATPERLGALADGLVARVDWATSAVQELRPYAERARAVAGSVRSAGHSPDLQRVHGDYHLGQVLHSAERGWVLLDFEGEPLRPLAERSVPDLALRDVAGMLRSFDYAGRHATVGSQDPAAAARAQAWTEAGREAFLDGYADVAGLDPRTGGAPAVLLRALELDKALYEVVYEARNRPDWLPIPLAAVERLLS